MKKGLIIKLAIGLCVIVMLVSGGILLKNYLEEKKGVDTYSDLEQFIAPPPGVEIPDTPVSEVPPEAPPMATPAESAPTDTPAPEPDAEADTEYGDAEGEPAVYVEKPAPSYWPVVDFEGLAAVNDHVVAWILGPGTNINYPVVQGTDNEYYLNHLFTGASSKAGAIFMDYRNHSDFSHRNSIIYGHHMRNRSMFWTLTQYRSQSYFNKHPTLRLVTRDGSFELHVVASYVASVEDNAWKVGFDSSEAFLDWVAEARAKSDVSTSVEVTESDRVVTLSTCTYEFTNARYIVLCKLIAV